MRLMETINPSKRDVQVHRVMPKKRVFYINELRTLEVQPDDAGSDIMLVVVN